MVYHVIELYHAQAQKYSTGAGQVAIVSFLVLKMLMLVSICEAAFGNMGWGSKDGSNLPWYKDNYGGVHSGVECDTKTPGCEHLCIDSFFPISPE